MNDPLYRVGDRVTYAGASTNLNGRVGVVKRVKRDAIRGDHWNYSVVFGTDRAAWKIHERNLAVAEAAPFRQQYGTATGRISSMDSERRQHAQLVNNSSPPPIRENPLFGGSALSDGARPEPMPVRVGSRIVLTATPLKGAKGTVKRLWSGSFGRLMVDVELDVMPEDWLHPRASFSASSLAPLIERTPEPRGLWKDGKKVRVTDFSKILHRKGQMHGPVDGMIMAQALSKHQPS